jgi:hypothetical protein
MKKLLLFCVCFIVYGLPLFSQNIGVKTNFAHWATLGSPNLGMEVAMGRKYSFELSYGINPWEFNDNKKAKHWLVQPEARRWFCETFNGHFVGLHGLAGEFNIGGIDIPVGRLSAFKDYRYEGFAYGGGLSYGYQWLIGQRWNFEASLGGGYAYITYDKFPCVKCGDKIGSGAKNYFGVTKAAVSLIYFIK